MKYIWTIPLLLSLAGVLLACQPAGQETVVPGETESSGLPPVIHPTETAVPLSTPEETAMASITPPNEAAETLVTLVKQHLARRLGIAPDQIVLSDIKPVVWRDAGLGCPKPSIDYIQIKTPGYNILLAAGGKTYRYHTDETKRFVPCDR